MMKISCSPMMYFILLVVSIFFSYIKPVYSYNFVPTEIEFNLWPYKCRAIYASTRIGQNIDFTRVIPDEDVRKWRREADLNGGAWHYCAGLVHIGRGNRELNKQKQAEHYLKAHKEINFTYQRLKKHSTWRHEILTALAHVHYLRGNHEKAQNMVERVIEIAPQYARAYIMSAMIYREQKKLKQAKTVLMKGKSVLEEESAELYYLLGLVSLERKEIGDAKKYADKAYELGYPLPWLKNKLKKYSAQSNK